MSNNEQVEEAELMEDSGGLSNISILVKWGCGLIMLIFSFGFTYSSITSKMETLEKDCTNHDRHHDHALEQIKTNFTELDSKVEKKAYNNEQLTYRLNSSQQKQIDALILSSNSQEIRYEYIQDALKEIKDNQNTLKDKLK